MKYPAAILVTAILAVSATASTALAHDRDRDHRERERVTVIVEDDHPRYRHWGEKRPHRHAGRRHWRHWRHHDDHPIYRPRYRYYPYQPTVILPPVRNTHWGLQLFYFD